MKRFLILGLALLSTFAAAESQLIVRLQPGANPNLLALKYRAPLRDVTVGAPFALFGVPRYVHVEALQARFAVDPAVVWAEDNQNVTAPENQGAGKGSTLPAIGGRSSLYATNTGTLNQINWSSSLANSAGRTVKIAILDTGLSTEQQYLWDKVVASVNFVEPDRPADDRPFGYDTNRNGTDDEAVGHGTMVAGIIDEVAPQTQFVIARVADSDGNASAWTVLKGLAFAVTSGAEVANVSLGSAANVPALNDVMDWVETQGMVVVSGAGNQSQSNAYSPARSSKVVCVTALKPDNTKAPFSNWDSGADMAAPGTGIVSQWWDGHQGAWNGTSFSAPFVAGAIADCLRRSSHPLSPSTIRGFIGNSGTDIDNLNRNYRGKLGNLLDIQDLNSFFAGL